MVLSTVRVLSALSLHDQGMEDGGLQPKREEVQTAGSGAQRTHTSFRQALLTFAEQTHGLFRSGITVHSVERSLRLSLDTKVLPSSLRVKEGYWAADPGRQDRSCLFDAPTTTIVMKPGSMSLLGECAQDEQSRPEVQKAVRILIRDLVQCGVEAIQMSYSNTLEKDSGQSSQDPLRDALAEAVARYRERECATYLGLSHMVNHEVDGYGIAGNRYLGTYMGILGTLGRLPAMNGRRPSVEVVVDELLDAGALPQTLPDVIASMFAHTMQSGDGAPHPTEAMRARYEDEIAAAVDPGDGSERESLDLDPYHRGQVIAIHIMDSLREESRSRRVVAIPGRETQQIGLTGSTDGTTYHRTLSSGTTFPLMS